MRNECNIVKDLLPLYIDGAVSEDSRKLVEEHTAICEDCAKERREMLLALPENAEGQAEHEVIIVAARRLRWKHMRRGMLLTLAGLVLGLTLIFGGKWLHWYLWQDSSMPMPLDRYEVRMSTLQSNRLVLSFVRQGFSSGYGAHFEDAEDGNGRVMILQLHTTRLRHKDDNDTRVSTIDKMIWQDGKILMDDGTQIVTIIREGPHGERDVFYQYGVDESLIAPASAEMEEYFRLDDEIALCWDWYHTDFSIRALINETELPFARIGEEDAFREKLDELNREQNAVEATVPEWQ